MSNVIEASRHYCMLGSQQTVAAIERAVPIIHAGPGCSNKLWWGLSFCNGFQSSGFACGNTMPCSNLSEKEVVFGGEKRLQETISGALSIMDADIFVVLTGCVADIVGDDTGQVVREFQTQGVPIVYAETGGFKGTTFQGYEAVVEAIIKQYLDGSTQSITPGLVNIWSTVPYQDPYWSGNNHAIKELLNGIGLKANIMFGPGSGGVEAWKRIPSAQFNLLISPWTGLNAVKLLEETYGTQYLHYPVLPIGAMKTGNFLRQVAEFAGINKIVVDSYIKEQEDRYHYYFERLADFLVEYRSDLPNYYIVISDSYYTLGVNRFLSNELGLLPGTQYITDETPMDYQERITSELRNSSNTSTATVRFMSDSGAINDDLRTLQDVRVPIIIGSDWDKDIANELDTYHFGLSLPITNRVIMDCSYIGYKGGLRFLEDMYYAVLRYWL